MRFFSKELISKLRQIDLFTYLSIYNPDELVFISKGNYCTKTHDSLKISNGMWYWFSKGIGSNSALDYLIKVEGYSFIDALNKLNCCFKTNKIVKVDVREKEKKHDFILPDKDKKNDKIISYLMSRGIDKEIINECINKELIYQDKDKNNVVFVGYDKNHIPRYGFVRGTNNTRYMHDIYGSHKAFSFKLIFNENNETIHIFESSIDLLSYASILKLNNKDWKNENYLSLGGIYQPPKDLDNAKMPIALMYYLNQNPDTKKIIFHLDNDKAGRLSTYSYKKCIPNKYEVIDEPSSYGKDINDFLCFLKGKSIVTNYKNEEKIIR